MPLCQQGQMETNVLFCKLTLAMSWCMQHHCTVSQNGHDDLFLGLFLAGCKKWINCVCLCLRLDVQIDFKCDTHVWTSLQHGTNATFTHKQMNGQMNEHVEHWMELQNFLCLGLCLAGCQKWSHCVWVCFCVDVQMELRCDTHVQTCVLHMSSDWTSRKKHTQTQWLQF